MLGKGCAGSCSAPIHELEKHLFSDNGVIVGGCYVPEPLGNGVILLETAIAATLEALWE